MNRPRSLNSMDKAEVRFINKTNCRAALIWIDYNGDRVKYLVLNNGEYLDVNTYQTHPWVCVDEYSGLHLLLNGKKVHYPMGVQEAERQLERVRVPMGLIDFRTNVFITVPLSSLRDICLRSLMSKISDSREVSELPIPNTLKADLCSMILTKRTYFKELKRSRLN